jgi:hypothetical protein
LTEENGQREPARTKNRSWPSGSGIIAGGFASRIFMVLDSTIVLQRRKSNPTRRTWSGTDCPPLIQQRTMSFHGRNNSSRPRPVKLVSRLGLTPVLSRFLLFYAVMETYQGFALAGVGASWNGRQVNNGKIET